MSLRNSQIHEKSYSSFTDDTNKGNPTIQFEEILSDMGFGYYQMYVFVIVGLIGMCDAGETQGISLVLPILEIEWGITAFQESLLGSLVYVGSMFSGVIADRHGRRIPIVVASALMSIIAIAGSFMPNYPTYLIMRVILVACIGFIIPIAFSMLAENTSLKHRGIVLVSIGIFYTSGELLVCLLAYIYMPSLKSGNWRLVLAYSSVPAILTLLISVILLLESPRFYLIKNEVVLAKTTIEKIFKINNRPTQEIDISVYEHISQQLINQQKAEQGVDSIDNDSPMQQISKLLSGSFTRITLIVWYQWIVNTFVFAGITFLLPLTLKKLHPNDTEENSSDLQVIALSCVGELPVIFIAMVVVNIKWLGRKNSLAIAYLTVGIIGILIVTLENSDTLFNVMIAGSKMFINLAFTISYQFVSELYPTYMRASGLGCASSIGRIGSIIMPWIVVYLNEIGTFLSYGIFGVLALLAALGTMSLPFDTYRRELDQAVV